MDKGKDDHVLYHVLRSGDDGVDLDSAESYQELSNNAIADTLGASEKYDLDIGFFKELGASALTDKC